MVRVVIISVVLLGLFPAASCGSSRGGGVAELYPASYEVGSVGYADRVMARATMRNVGDGVLNIQNVRSNCTCYLVSIPGKSIRLDGETSSRRVPVVSLQPGESVTLEFDLTFPKDKTPRNAFFYVLSDDLEERLLTFLPQKEHLGVLARKKGERKLLAKPRRRGGRRQAVHQTPRHRMPLSVQAPVRTFTTTPSVNKDPSLSLATPDEIVLQLPKKDGGVSITG